jgi:hypothetical protein
MNGLLLEDATAQQCTVRSGKPAAGIKQNECHRECLTPPIVGSRFIGTVRKPGAQFCYASA